MERKASFSPRVRDYWLAAGIIVLGLSIVGIPLLLLWIPLGRYFTSKYLEKLECVLTDRHLIVSKGIFFRMEKTVPLGKITDLGMVQGPLMRYYGVHSLSIETAGQSAQGALVTLTGIENVIDFRREVLAQRDRLERAYGGDSSAEVKTDATDLCGQPQASPEITMLLREIRDSIIRIESTLAATKDSFTTSPPSKS